MKENPDIDELLNSFIDEELTSRQRTEVQRLIAHDEQIANRLAELQKCKMLIASLPSAEAPAEMTEQIKASLRRRTLLSQQPAYGVERSDEHKGARHLLVRKFAAVAAMIGLVVILAATVYTIVSPKTVTDKPIAADYWQQPTREVEADKPRPSLMATTEKPVDQTSLLLAATGKGTEFNGRLELKTSTLNAVDAFINRAIDDNDHCTITRSQQDGSVYALSCRRESLNLLLANLGNIWQKLDSATLFVETDQLGEQVAVNAVSAEQIAEIVNQDNLPKRIEVAKNFAVLNSMAELLPGKELLAAIDDRRPKLITIPKPVLTSGTETEKPARQPQDHTQVHLTIVVSK